MKNKNEIQEVLENVVCTNCKSQNVIKKGKYSFRKIGEYVIRYRCKDCDQSFQGPNLKIEDKLPIPFVYKNKTLDKINWNLYNQIQTNEKTTILELLNELLNLLDIPKPNKIGRPTKNIKDIIYSLLLKIYCRLSSRRLISELQLAKELGYIKEIPSFNTILNYLSDNRITLILQQLIELSSKPLINIEKNFSVDSTGFSTFRYASWYDHKYNKNSIRKIFLKAHTMIGNLTNIITSITITDQNGSDCIQFSDLVKKTAINFKINDVCADKAYNGRDCYDVVARLGGTPYIDFKSNSTESSKGTQNYIWNKMYNLSKKNPQEFYTHYHMRSNVECTYNMIKQKFGTELMGKTYESNANEILCKAVCHNLCCLISAYLELNLDSNICAEALKQAEFVKS